MDPAARQRRCARRAGGAHFREQRCGQDHCIATGPPLRWKLLANDRVFVRAGPSGVQILPWPAAAAIGLGLLDALGLYDLARDCVRADEQLHPIQDERVTTALRAGHRAGQCDLDDRELKAQVFPDQLRGWFELPLATSGIAAVLLFPTVVSGAHPLALSSAAASLKSTSSTSRPRTATPISSPYPAPIPPPATKPARTSAADSRAFLATR